MVDDSQDRPLEALLERLPDSPGVYLMKSRAGEILYVGKARNLRKRVSSYFSGSLRLDPKTELLVTRIHSFETILTETEQEALLLEANLIKRHHPRYNVFHRDDKRYPSLRMDLNDPYPALEVVRRTKKDGARYFGPFASAQAVRETLRIIHRTFKLRKCKTYPLKPRTRPCLNYQMGQCLGLCGQKVPEKDYRKIVDEVVLFLKGRTPQLISKIEKEMQTAARRLDFETAAVLRDKKFALERTLEKQVSVCTDFRDRDVFAVARIPELTVVTRLHVRGGFLLGTQHFEFGRVLSTDAEALGSFIRGYYEKGHFIPEEILTPVALEEGGWIQKTLSDAKGRRVHLSAPRRGEKARLVGIAVQNAENRLKTLAEAAASDLDRLLRLKRRLGMPGFPERIECIDTSATFGVEPVASLVVFEKGASKPSAYRHYRIRTAGAPDDYAFMEEVLRRRFEDTEKKEMPDLLMVDGGKGQLNIAAAVARELGIENAFFIIAIAKKDRKKGEGEDKIYTLQRADPVRFGRDADLLRLLERIRDEAHRFAIAFHRKKRQDRALRSALDAVPGIGEKRKKVLLAHFGGVDGIRRASLDEIATLPSMTENSARILLDALKAQEEIVVEELNPEEEIIVAS